MRTELSEFILSFERLNYREVDFIIKKLWMTFEVAWEKECLEKECVECHQEAAEHRRGYFSNLFEMLFCCNNSYRIKACFIIKKLVSFQ